VSRPRRRAAVALVAPALLAAACGGASEGSRVVELWGQLATRIGLAPAEDGTPRGLEAAPAEEPAADGVLAAISRALEADAGAEDAGPGYWRYTEANGSLRFVQTLAEVPASARATAERIAAAAPRSAADRSAPPRAPLPARPAALTASEPERQAAPTVVVYTTSWCGWCRKTLAWLDERGVDYENRDIERNPEWAAELQRKTGGQSIPVVDVDGRIVRGFAPGTLEELL
jgi:glutaredoxin